MAERLVKEVLVRARAEGIAAVAAEMDRLRDSYVSVNTVETKLSRETIDATGAFDRLRRSVDETARAQYRLEQATKTADRALAQGKTTVEERDRVLALAQARYTARLPSGQPAQASSNDNHSSTSRSISPEYRQMLMRDLAFQGKDFFEQVISGSSPFRAALMQGPQAASIMSMGGFGVGDVFKSAADTAGGLLSKIGPLGAGLGVVGTAFAAAAVAGHSYATSQEEVEKSLRGIGRLSGGSREGINQMAMETADAAKLSVGAAREMGSTFASVGRIGQERFGDLTIAASRMGKTLGIDAKDAAERLAKAFGGDILKGTMDLNESLGFLNARTAETIEKQVAMGDRAGAIKTATDAMTTSLVSVTHNTNAWAAAWDSVARAAKNAYDATGRSVMSMVAPTPAQALASRQEELERAQRELDRVRGGSIDPAHLEFMRRAGYSQQQMLAEGAPSAPGTVMKNIAEAEARVEKLKQDVADAAERAHWAQINIRLDQRNAEIAEVTMKARGIVGSIMPTTADMLQLREYATTLQNALNTGQAGTGTKETLAVISKMLTDGGRMAHEMKRAADEAFDAAGLLPYARGLQEIEFRYHKILETATDPKVRAGLEAAREKEKAAFRVTNSDVVQRDYGMRLGEMGRALEFQRDSFGKSDEAVETLRARMEMLNDAARTGQDVTQRYGAGWESLAAQMGRAKAATDDLQRSQQNVIAGMDEMRSGSRGLLTGVFSDLRQGKDPRQNIASGLGRMADQMFDRGISKPLFEAVMGRDGTAQGGLLGNAWTGIFGDVGSLPIANDNPPDSTVAA